MENLFKTCFSSYSQLLNVWSYGTHEIHMVDAEDTFIKLELSEHHNTANIEKYMGFFCAVNTFQLGEAQKKSEVLA